MTANGPIHLNYDSKDKKYPLGIGTRWIFSKPSWDRLERYIVDPSHISFSFTTNVESLYLLAN